MKVIGFSLGGNMLNNFILDVDGVMTTGQFLYSEKGKVYKIFGPHDADGLKILKNKLNIVFITADKRGFSISEKRISDMGYRLELITEKDRYSYIKEKFGFENTAYMGDGIFDAPILRDCKFGIAPRNARIEAKKAADFVTPSASAEGAVCDACIQIDDKFFSNDYKVCIPAAGTGSRMGEFTKTFNKALIPVNGKPAICHIIEKFPENVEIVIAVGYKKGMVIDYLNSTYINRKLTFVDVGKFEGPGTGPGYSILQCKQYLQCPFIFVSADTLVSEDIPEPNFNWFGLAEVPDTSRFCSASVSGNKVIRIDDKVKSDNKYAFIGLAGVYDYEVFWNALENNDELIGGEIQVSNGFTSLIEEGMRAEVFTWFDTGVPSAYRHALKNYPNGEGYLGE